MHLKSNIIRILAKWDRGSNGVVPFLRFFTAAVVFMAVVNLSGCSGGNEELIPLESVSDDQTFNSDGTAYGENDTDRAAQTDCTADEACETQTGNNNALTDTVADTTADIAADTTVYVYVCGAVERPDVYELSVSDHIVDGIKAAGGFTEDADEDALNLALRVSDGMKIYVPRQGEEVSDSVLSSDTDGSMYDSGITGNGATTGNENSTGTGTVNNSVNDSSTGSLININTASKDELMQLPGIGEGKASKIIEYRENNGPFSQNSDIMNVSGIKNAAYEKIRNLICVG